MKHNRVSLSLLLILFSVFLVSACRGTSSQESVFPFSEAAWDSTEDDIFALEGTGYTTYDSLYGGICYTYPKTYIDREGTVKYMFDGKHSLMSVAWTCSSDSQEDLIAVYDQIQESATSRYGDTSNEQNGGSNYGKVWHREEGNIVLSVMMTESLKALQYAYLNPAVSTPADA